MTELEIFHKNDKLLELLKYYNKSKSYNQYQIACGINNIVPANKETFKEHIKVRLVRY